MTGQVNRALRRARSKPPAWTANCLLLAGTVDLILPSVAETQRLAEALPGATRKLLGGAAHACLDDPRALNLRLELDLAGILPELTRPSALATPVLDGVVVPALPCGDMGQVDPAPASLFEGWLQGMRNLFSPVFFSLGASGGIERGLAGLPPSSASAPLLFVGNHQLFGFDGPMIIEELLRERGQLLRPLVFPPLLAEQSPLAPLPYPLSGTAATFERFGAIPVSARALYGALRKGESVLLFPGGAREVFKRKGENYEIFWPGEPDVVRLAARFNATIVPFSGIGGDESFSIAMDSQELLDAPITGPFFSERIDSLPSLVEGDIFVPPMGFITPKRHYFLFGEPFNTAAIDPSDRDACNRVYAQLRQRVRGGISRLQDEVRAADPYEGIAQRSVYEAFYGRQAPSS